VRFDFLDLIQEKNHSYVSRKQTQLGNNNKFVKDYEGSHHREISSIETWLAQEATTKSVPEQNLTLTCQLNKIVVDKAIMDAVDM